MPRFFERLDPEALVKQIAAANASALLVHTKCHEGNAYYNTTVGHKHSHLGARDMIAEFSKACRTQGLNLLFYHSIGWDRRAFNDHPEFRVLDPEGVPRTTFRQPGERPGPEFKVAVCLNGPYRDYLKRMLAELTSNYDFDGYWLDVVTVWTSFACHCQVCRDSYRSETGRAMPRDFSGADGQDYLRWRVALNSRIMHELSGHIHSIKPNVTVSHNQSAFGRLEDWDFCDRDAYASHEYHYPEGPAELSLTCLRNHALKPDVPFEVEIWRFANRLSPTARFGRSRAYQTRPSETLLTEMATVAAHGGFPQYYDNILWDGSLDSRSMAAITPVFKSIREGQPWTRRGRRIPYAAIVWSKLTERFSERGALHPSGLRASIRR